MKRPLWTCWAVLLVTALAGLYTWIGLAAHGLTRVAALAGTLLILAALPTARRSRTAATALLTAGALPLALVAWWSLAAPLLGALTLTLGVTAIRAVHTATTGRS